jgi:putative membrane protein
MRVRVFAVVISPSPARGRAGRRRLFSKSRGFHLRILRNIQTSRVRFINMTIPLLLAQTAVPASWHASSLLEALLYMAIFALAGIFLAIAGYKLFDYCTPGNLHEEIVKNRNLAAAIVGGAVILGVSIVVAAAIVG